MELISDWLSQTVRFLPFLATLGGVVLVLSFLSRHFSRRWKDNPELQFRYQLMMLALTLAGGLAILITLPINDTLRGQLLSLIGILLSAAIALSATTFIGNILAGIMLKVVRGARPGDFITIGDLTGRVTEMDLLHTQVQTEFRDLVTVPNLFMVTQPLHVVRASGTIIHTDVSLGYDVHHERATEALLEGATASGLKDVFVQVRNLGDFSIVYRVAGLLEDVQSLITARSNLRREVLNGLHGAGIEIVSPNFMNTRSLGDHERFLPERYRAQGVGQRDEARAEEVAFDVAEEAASIEGLRSTLTAIEDELERLKKDKPGDYEEKLDRLKSQKNRLEASIEAAEARLAKNEG
jgi:small-conductance mechanosensitive channel